MQNHKNLAVLILAAGKSSRLGEPKQLVKYKGESLLRIAVKNALEISKDVFVVLGHKKNECFNEIKDLKVNTLLNENYKKGIGTSISYGIQNLKEYQNLMICLCDQPFIDVKHLKKLKDKINKQNIIATQYIQLEDSTVPAIFPSKYYDELSKLNEDFGAKKILNQNQCINIKLEKEKSVDIDTIDDIKTYLLE